jgi:hypothetical protein
MLSANPVRSALLGPGRCHESRQATMDRQAAADQADALELDAP